MRAGLIALLVVACAAGACSKKSSLYLDPGERGASAKAAPPPAAPPVATQAIPASAPAAKAPAPPKP